SAVAPDVAGAHRNHTIAVPGYPGEVFGQRLFVFHVVHVPVSVTLGQFGDEAARDPREGLFACAIDVGQDEHVRIEERPGKLELEVACTGVQVRLADRNDATVREAGAGRRTRGRDLSRMVRVVVEHEDAALLADLLESPLDARKL